MTWRKARRSNGAGGACIEAATTTNRVAVRDSKDRDGGQLRVSARAWERFTRSLR